MNKLTNGLLQVIVAVVITTIIVSLGGMFFYHKMVGEPEVKYGSATNPSLVQIEMGDKNFSIPQNHIRFRGDWVSGEKSGVNLHALLPEFSPYTRQNKPYFDKPGWNKKITVLLHEHNIKDSHFSKTSMTRKEIYHRITHDYGSGVPYKTTSQSGPYGLTVEDMHSNSNKQLYSGSLPNGDFYWVKCSREETVPNPSCSGYFAYSTYTTIKYTFAKAYLEHWKTLDNDVRNFIHNFDTTSIRGN